MKTATKQTKKGIARAIAIVALIFIGFTSAYARGGWGYQGHYNYPRVIERPVYRSYHYIPVCVHPAPVVYYRHGCRW